MNADYFYRLVFILRIHEAQGTAFERLAANVLEAALSGFQRVAPYGRRGDGGNDGCIPAEGRYFQMHAPAAASARSAVAAATKARADFGKLRQSWPDVRHYTFVFNDRFEGLPAPLHEAIRQIAVEHRVTADALGAGGLTDLFMHLPEDRRQMIVGGIPGDAPPFFDAGELGDLLRHLADDAHGFGLASKALAPDFEAKIAFNGLSEVLATRLRDRSYQADAVDRFLAARDQHLAEAIAAQLRARFDRSADQVPRITDLAPESDLRYVWLVENLVPDVARSHPHSLKAYRGAAEVVIARYFEACDVFEHPSPGRGPT